MATQTRAAAVSQERKQFTVEEANRALPYVQRIVSDVCRDYTQAVEIQHQLQKPLSEHQSDQLRDQYERLMDRLNRYVDELTEAGVELKDYELGLVDFPAMHEGREVLLCWKLGEKQICAWHEVNGGFGTRQDVAKLNSGQ